MAPYKEKLIAYDKQRKISDSTAFKLQTKQDAEIQLAKELDKLLQTAPFHEKNKISDEFEGFKRLFLKFLAGTGPSVQWDKIEPLPQGAILHYESLREPSNAYIKDMLNKLVVIKLNGGLGTSMGCIGPKSIIPVRSELTFLDLTVQQIEYLNKTYDADVPLVLMNSFNTDEDTQKILVKYRGFRMKIYTFMQSRYPRLNKESMLPIGSTLTTPDPEAWYPPGHGDFYDSFYKSGLLENFINLGKEYCFVSNIDNLGATIDLNILNMLLGPAKTLHPGFVMEVTDKTNADVKGGTLIHYEGKLRLLEITQVPKDNAIRMLVHAHFPIRNELYCHVTQMVHLLLSFLIQNITLGPFKQTILEIILSQIQLIFNTNNMWMKLKSIENLVTEGKLNMEIIVNPKLLDYGLNVIQLETASGAAIKDFEGAIGINVPRSRFLPVKKTSDLLLAMSNLYLMKNGNLLMNPNRPFPSTPLIKLGDQHFSKVAEFLWRFASIPDMLELDHLTVSGDVTFGKGVTLKGTVIVIANHGDRIDIPPGAILENKIVSGNLRILDH